MCQNSFSGCVPVLDQVTSFASRALGLHLESASAWVVLLSCVFSLVVFGHCTDSKAAQSQCVHQCMQHSMHPIQSVMIAITVLLGHTARFDRSLPYRHPAASYRSHNPLIRYIICDSGTHSLDKAQALKLARTVYPLFVACVSLV